jgi:hypothetical protein
MNNYERLEGMVAATFTPMDENGDVNLSVIEKYADWIASTPIKGVFVCGTTGEFSSLTIDERKLILEKWVASAGKPHEHFCARSDAPRRRFFSRGTGDAHPGPPLFSTMSRVNKGKKAD